MKTRIASRAESPAGLRALLPALSLLAASALAGEPPVPAPHDFDTDLAVSRAVAPMPMSGQSLAAGVMPEDGALDEAAADAPAEELAAGLGAQMDRSRRKFRASAIDWVMERSVAMGHLADFLVGGADSGWHLVVDTRGDDEYSLQWKARFR